MEFLSKALAVLFALAVCALAIKALRNALKFSDAGIFNFFAIIFFLILTVPPCRPYTQKAFLWGWQRLPPVITQESIFNSRSLQAVQTSKLYLWLGGNWDKTMRESTRAPLWESLQYIPRMAFFGAGLLVYLLACLIFVLLFMFYFRVVITAMILLWNWYIFPPILGFFAYDIASWAANAPIIGIPAAYLFAPFDAAFSGLRRKKMDIELVKLRSDIVNKVNAIDRTQSSPIAINTSELRGALNSSTLLTKWFRGWKGRASSSMDQRALDSLTQTMNAYITLLDSYDRLGMQQHKMRLMETRQELYERELVAQAEQIEAERKKAVKEQAVAELTTLEAKAEKEKLETQLEKLKKKYNV